MSARPFDAVFVCTGNRFRSPLAEAAFLRAAGGVALVARSCGTMRVGSKPALPEAISEAVALGLDLGTHRATCLDDTDLRGAHLVVGFERAHLAAAVVDGGAARDAAYTLPEIVGLLEEHPGGGAGDPVERARGLVAWAGEERRRLGRAPGSIEIADPLGRREDAQRATAVEVVELAARLGRLLFG